MTQKSNTLSISIMSGKGGVGKTNIALNIAYALYQKEKGHPTMLMDCDLGLANLDVLLGISPEKNLEDLLQPDVEPEDVLVGIEENGFDFLPAASGVPELVEWDNDYQAILFQKLNTCFSNYDYLLMDLGAGINSTVLTLAGMTDIQCVVISSEPTSLTDGYALIKVLSHRYNLDNFMIIVNMVSSKKEGEQAFQRLQSACESFLGIKTHLLGVLLNDKSVSQAIARQTPLGKFAPESPTYRDIESMALRLHNIREKSINNPEPLQLKKVISKS
ncbi:MAG: MinD/ParA family protein [Thermodesulfobacteriota bacterium]